MSQDTDSLHAYVALHSESQVLQKSDWLEGLRTSGLEHFQHLGFPTTRNEDWKYTDLRGMLRQRFALVSSQSANDDAISQLLQESPDAHRLVFIDGTYSPKFSEYDAEDSEFVLTSIAEQLSTDPDTLKAHLGSCADIDRKAFAALNTAFVNDGAFIRIRQSTQLEKPIDLVFVCTGSDEAQFITPRVSIFAEQDSSASIIERHLCLSDKKYFSNAVTEIELLPGAQLEHCKLQLESKSAYHIGGLFTKQQRNSRLVSHAIMLGARLARNEIHASLSEPDVHCDLNGLFIANGRQHLDNYTHIHHATHHGTSRELYKGVIDDHAHGVFHGRIVVNEDAQKTDAQQQNNNLLLSRNAEIDTKPQLEIYADDVKCAHGATVGQLDDSALFYLRSRGIELAEARAILTQAFAADVVTRLKNDQLRGYVEAVVSRRFNRPSINGVH